MKPLFSRCKYKYYKEQYDPCNGYPQKSECRVPRVSIDSSVIIDACGETKHTKQCSQIIEKYKNNRIYIPKVAFAEIFRYIRDDVYNSNRPKGFTTINVEENSKKESWFRWIKGIEKVLPYFGILDFEDKKEETEIFNRLKDIEGRRFGISDCLILTSTIFHKCNLFLTKDDEIWYRREEITEISRDYLKNFKIVWPKGIKHKKD